MSGWVIAAHAVAAFNLVCSGTSTIREVKRTEAQTTPYHAVIRVDLSQRRYCLDRCRETFPLAAVSPSQIVLQDGPILGGTVHHAVDRKSGRYTLHVNAELGPNGFENLSEGTCERATFGGFPDHERARGRGR